jgi:hypothetical protein
MAPLKDPDQRLWRTDFKRGRKCLRVAVQRRHQTVTLRTHSSE